MQIDAFEQWARDLAAIALDRFGMTVASARRIAGPAERAERRCFLPFVRVRLKSLIWKPYDFEPKTVGDHIRRRRLMLAITQEEAATRLGVNAWTVHNSETGQPKPEIRFIPALVEFLGYDPEPVDEGTLAGRLVGKRRSLVSPSGKRPAPFASTRAPGPDGNSGRGSRGRPTGGRSRGS